MQTSQTFLVFYQPEDGFWSDFAGIKYGSKQEF